MCGNYSREETIQGRKLYEEIRYMQNISKSKSFGRFVLIVIQNNFKNEWTFVGNQFFEDGKVYY